MKKIVKILAVLALTTFFNAPFTQAQTDKVYRVEQTTVYFFDEIDYAFYQAYSAFQNNQNAYAGSKIRRAAYFVRLEAQDAKAHNQQPILNQAKRLEAFADSVGLGRVQSPIRLRHNFSRTHRVLANDYQLRAAAFWTADKARDAGQAMEAAAGYVGHAAMWSGKKIAQGADQSVRGVRTLTGAMIKGVGFVPKHVGKALTWLGDSIDKVGDNVKPVKPKEKLTKPSKQKKEKKNK